MTLLGISLAVALIFGLGLLYLVFRNGGSGGYSKLDKKVVQEKWREIEIMSQQGGPANFTNAIIQADKLLDYVLKGIVGDKREETMVDRMKLAQKKFSDWSIYQEVWSAHKVRNKVVHDMNHELHSSVARKTIEQFRKGLRDLGLL